MVSQLYLNHTDEEGTNSRSRCLYRTMIDSLPCDNNVIMHTCYACKRLSEINKLLEMNRLITKISALLVIYIYRGGTVHVFVFVPNRHGTDLSVRCMRPYNEYRQFTPNPEGGARSNATLFDNCQQKNSKCRELRS